jgi:glycosyltransferase involved in cell wall biosynthesis
MNVLIIAPSKSSFIESDYNILKDQNKTELIISWSLLEIFRTIKVIHNYDLCIFWFASLRFVPSYIIAKIFRKKVFIIAGGYDVSSLPKLNYGGMRKGTISSYIRKILLSFADKVITVSDSNSNEVINNSQIPITKLKRIYLGFEKPKIELIDWKERKNQVVLIACCDAASIKIKGFDVFLELARLNPDVNFIHIGAIKVERFKNEASKLPNITCLGYLKNYDYHFSLTLNQSKIILSTSLIESFGASVIEGALHGCVPVVSSNYSLPEIIGNKGEACSSLTEFNLALQKILFSEVNVTDLQQYYYSRFNISNRTEAFRNLLNDLILQ